MKFFPTTSHAIWFVLNLFVLAQARVPSPIVVSDRYWTDEKGRQCGFLHPTNTTKGSVCSERIDLPDVDAFSPKRDLAATPSASLAPVSGHRPPDEATLRLTRVLVGLSALNLISSSISTGFTAYYYVKQYPQLFGSLSQRGSHGHTCEKATASAYTHEIDNKEGYTYHCIQKSCGNFVGCSDHMDGDAGARAFNTAMEYYKGHHKNGAMCVQFKATPPGGQEDSVTVIAKMDTFHEPMYV